MPLLPLHQHLILAQILLLILINITTHQCLPSATSLYRGGSAALSESGSSTNGSATTLSASHSSSCSPPRYPVPAHRALRTSRIASAAADADPRASTSRPQMSSAAVAGKTRAITSPGGEAVTSTSTTTSSPPPAGMGAPQPPQLERRTSLVTNFSSFSSTASKMDLSGSALSLSADDIALLMGDEYDQEEEEEDASNSNGSRMLSRRASTSTSHTSNSMMTMETGSGQDGKKAKVPTTSKGALELLTKGRITSNLAIYKPRELWKVRFLIILSSLCILWKAIVGDRFTDNNFFICSLFMFLPYSGSFFGLLCGNCWVFRINSLFRIYSCMAIRCVFVVFLWLCLLAWILLCDLARTRACPVRCAAILGLDRQLMPHTHGRTPDPRRASIHISIPTSISSFLIIISFLLFPWIWSPLPSFI